MRRLTCLLTLLTVIAAASIGSGALAAPEGTSTPQVSAGPWHKIGTPVQIRKTDEVIVRFKLQSPGVVRKSALQESGLFSSMRSVTPGDPDSTTMVRLKPGVTVEEALAELRAMPEVAYAQQDSLASTFYTPTDTGFPNQWGLQNTGQTIGGVPGTPGADIDATSAWDIEMGNTSAVEVAVVDTGADLGHPDLSGKLVTGYNWAGISCLDLSYYGLLGDGNDVAYAQSITGTGGDLTNVGTLLGKNGSPSGGITVSVRTSLTGPDLASYNISPAEFTSSGYYDPARIYKAFSGQTHLNSGSTYYLVWSTANSDPSNYYYVYATFNMYAEGSEHYNDGSNWIVQTDYDLCFETNPNSVPYDDNGHGTHVSGIIGAAFNGQGVVGLSAGAKVMPLKALTSSGSGWTSGIAEAIRYAADNEADVVNMSLGSSEPDIDENTAVQYAFGKGVVVMAASGNDGNTTVSYPAGYSNVIGVGSTNNLDQKSDFSNYNSTVDISAPGTEIYSTMPRYDCMLTVLPAPYTPYSKNYDFLSGTSMATPMASGLAALVLSRNPSYTPAQVQDVLQKNADDLGSSGRDDQFGYGRINAYRTVTSTLVAPSVSSVSPRFAGPGTTVTIKGANFGSSRGSSYVSFGSAKATQYTSWKGSQIICSVPEAAAGTVGVTVKTAVGTSNSKEFIITSPTWYLAEGTSDWGFDTYVTIQNPNPSEVTAQVTYMTETGRQKRPDITLAPLSQTVINPRNDLGATDFSTKVVCKEKKTIAVDRRMIWAGTGAASPEGHSSVGVTSPAKTWYLPEGSSDWGFECWLLIQNPNEVEAVCEITYMIEGEDPVKVSRAVAAGSRASFDMADDIGARDASIKVTSSVPVIPERAMYRNNRREGHDSIGTTTPAKYYYLAEGTTDWGFTTYVLVQNPNQKEVTVTIIYMTPGGAVSQAPFTMPPNSRKTIRVNDALPAKDFSTRIKATAPVIAERAMYWNNGTGEATHDSIGMAGAHTTFYLPDGETYNGTETWTLVQNPNGSPVNVEISYLTPDGAGNKSLTDEIPASSRKSYFMADTIPQGRAAIKVTSKSAGKKIMVERAMYWNSRGAGTDTIGGYSD